MRQLDMFEKPCRLDVVAVIQHEFLVLRRGAELSSPSSRQRSARSTSAIAIALRSRLAEDQAVAAGELRRLGLASP